MVSAVYKQYGKISAGKFPCCIQTAEAASDNYNFIFHI